MATTIMGSGFRVQGLAGTGKKMATTLRRYIGTTSQIHSFIPS